MKGNGVWWLVGGGILSLVIGYVLGREHAKKQVWTTLRKKMPSMPW